MLKTTVAAAMAVLFAAPAAAQTRTGAVVGGSVGVLSIDSGTHAAVSGTIGYKLNSALSFGIEITGVPEMETEAPDFPLPLSAPSFPRFSREVEGSATFFTTNVRVDIPTISRRILPFVTGGGGVANLKQSFVISALPAFSTDVFTALSALGLSPSLTFPLPTPYPVTSSSTGMALTIGGGASILVTDHLSIDVDLRYFRIMSEVDRNAGRFGAGASYRF
jgi:opacity protein-like surface antigen